MAEDLRTALESLPRYDLDNDEYVPSPTGSLVFIEDIAAALGRPAGLNASESPRATPASQAPSSPTTEAGRGWVQSFEDWHGRRTTETLKEGRDLMRRILAIEQQARDEGRREAVRIVRREGHPSGCTVSGCHLEAGVAGLNASESPPTHMRQSSNGCVTCPRRWSDHSDAERGDASESPPTRPWLTIHGVEWLHRGHGLPDHIPDTYKSRCPECRDASESPRATPASLYAMLTDREASDE